MKLAAIRLAWPAMHSPALPQTLMQRLHAAIAARPAQSAFEHDAGILAQYVTG